MDYPEDIVESAALAAGFAGRPDDIFRVVASMLMAERNGHAGNRKEMQDSAANGRTKPNGNAPRCLANQL